MPFTPALCRREILRCGLLPFFPSAVPGFSVEEMFPGAPWWTDTENDPWNARLALAADEEIVYGKFFSGKAGFASREAYASLLNLRRDGYDFDTLVDMGRVPLRERRVMEAVDRAGRPVSAPYLKADAGFGSEGLKGFEGTVTALQQRCYLLISGSQRRRDKHGVEYGWHMNLYSTPEGRFGEEYVLAAYEEEPERSLERLVEGVLRAMPGLDGEGVRRLIAG